MRPIIGVPGLSSAKIQGLRFDASVAANAVLRAIQRAGGDPVVLSPLVDWANPDSRFWGLVDGLVLPGGPDVDPFRYGQLAEASYAGCSYDGQDDADAAAIAAAAEHGIPALLICRGMQLWNVERGGDLVQHWPQQPQEHVDTIHDVEVAPGSALAAALGEAAAGVVSVSSYHHQAVGRVGEGMRVTARAADGAVEALEDPELNIVAVQWHPEDRSDSVASDQALFDWVVAQARARSSEQNAA